MTCPHSYTAECASPAVYAPITTLHPYMGFHVLLVCFAVVLVGGLGSMRGRFVAAFALGMVIVVMAAVLVVKPIEV